MKAVETAATFVWLGMVVAISFIEAPLKFRAPGVTLPIGLGIGRLVFRALNVAEVVLGGAILVALAVDRPAARIVTASAVALASLAIQLAAVRLPLARRTDAVLAGADPGRSRAHYAYIALELVKVAALITAGTFLL